MNGKDVYHAGEAGWVLILEEEKRKRREGEDKKCKVNTNLYYGRREGKEHAGKNKEREKQKPYGKETGGERNYVRKDVEEGVYRRI